jgi:hypothetical protein
MILMKIAELLVCAPGTLKKLTSSSMWRALLASSSIKIAGVTISALSIFLNILKAEQPYHPYNP